MRQGSKIVYFLDKVSLIKDGGARKELPVNHVDATKSMVGLESTLQGWWAIFSRFLLRSKIRTSLKNQYVGRKKERKNPIE